MKTATWPWHIVTQNHGMHQVDVLTGVSSRFIWWPLYGKVSAVEEMLMPRSFSMSIHCAHRAGFDTLRDTFMHAAAVCVFSTMVMHVTSKCG